VPSIRLPIDTERLLIRRLRLDDSRDLHELYSDAESMRFLADAATIPRTLAESQAWVHGRGYATEASAAILRAAFDAGFNRVTAQTATDNIAALEVLRRLGFRIEGETEWEGRAMAFGVCELSEQPVETRT
jgi:RimJ/RimL family protein N-acetyltransferase